MHGGVLTTETGDEAADAGEPTAELAHTDDLQEAIRNASAYRQSQLRNFCENAIRLALTWPRLMRCLTGRLTLHAVAADLWPDQAERGDVLVGLVRGLAADGDPPEPHEAAAAASYAAMALALLHHEVPKLSVLDESNLRFRAAATLGAGMLNDVDPDRCHYCRRSSGGLGDAVAPKQVFELACEIQHPVSGPQVAISQLADDHDLRARLASDGAIELITPVAPGRPERELLLAVALTGSSGPVVVRGESSGTRYRAVWQQPWFLVERDGLKGTSGAVYRLDDGARTLALSWPTYEFTPAILGAPAERWPAGWPPTEHGEEWLRLVGDVDPEDER